MPAPDSPPESDQKDFFISYTGRDRAWAEWIAYIVEEAGFSTIIQAWDFGAGGDFLTAMDDAARRARKLMPVFSPAYFDSAFAHIELNSFLALDADGRKRLIIPVLIKKVSDHGLLRSRVHVDITALSESDAQRRIIAALKDERAKPNQRPAFPGSHRPHFPGDSAIASASPPETWEDRPGLLGSPLF